MAAAKKLMRICKTVLLTAVSLFALLSCGTKYDLNDENTDDNGNYVKDISGTIIFVNDKSDYNISVHQNNFEGDILVDKLPPGKFFAVKVPPDEDEIGSTFSFVYWKKIMKNEETGNGDVWAKKNSNFGEQLTKKIETGKEYTIRIPQPSEANFTESFFKIFNATLWEFRLDDIGHSYSQAGNGGFSVQSGKSGVYDISKIDNIGGLYIYYQSKPYPLPDVTVEGGYIYTFNFDGNEVSLTSKVHISEVHI
jgi:hypothetical protein